MLCPVRWQYCSLERVAGIGRIAQDTPTNAGHQRAVSLDQGGKRGLVPVVDEGHEQVTVRLRQGEPGSKLGERCVHVAGSARRAAGSREIGEKSRRCTESGGITEKGQLSGSTGVPAGSGGGKHPSSMSAWRRVAR